MTALDVFAPYDLGPLTLRNRVLKAATYEGMSPGGIAGGALADFHARLARGGVGLTTVAYCAVADEGRTFDGQLGLSSRSLGPLAELTRAVHREGGAASLQLAHAGFFSKVRGAGGRAPRGPSPAVNLYGMAAGLPYAPAMTVGDIDRVVDAFARAADVAVAVGFDAVELHLGHGYLLSQFLSPATNRRTDAYGGSLEKRLRLPLRVVRAVRDAVGRGVAVLAKTNLDDGFEGGLGIEESVAIARALESTGCLDALVLSGGFTSRSAFYLLRGGRPFAAMARAQSSRLMGAAMRFVGPLVSPKVPFAPRFFLPLARRVRAAVTMPLALLGGLVSIDDLRVAREEGFELVALGRALIADPDLPLEMARGQRTRTRCNACNLCLAEMDRGGVRCVL